MEASNSSRRVPPEKRKRTETSCDKCKSRKQKCDRGLNLENQCRYCELHNIECQTTQPRKKRIWGSGSVDASGNMENVSTKVMLLESLVKGLFPEADLSTNEEMQQLAHTLGIPVPVIDDVADETEKAMAVDEENHQLTLMPDQQGQVQFTGSASSFSFYVNLRRLIGSKSTPGFTMFGRNAAELTGTTSELTGLSKPCAGDIRDRRVSVGLGISDCGSPSEAVRNLDGQTLDSLIDAYFDTINPDFPVLHEATFREAYENWSSSPDITLTDPSWLCGLLCVLLLSCRVSPIESPEEDERHWWRHVQNLLPTVLFTSNTMAVQAILLAALYLHNSSHRDACYNLTGTAIRIAFAIGLHRDDLKHTQSPLNRELRKQLWWTLYAFEQMQVSSFDRPSGITAGTISVSCPNERMVGTGPQDLMKWSQRLVVLLGAACKALNPIKLTTSGTDGAYSKPLSPAAGILRDLNRWKDDLPQHLRLEAADSVAPSSQRPLLLLHAQFYYTLVVLTRSALLRHATLLSKNDGQQIPQIVLAVSETCANAGRQLARVIWKLDSIKRFNALTWWDVFYSTTSAQTLVLDTICRMRQHGYESAMESQSLLQDLAKLADRLLQNPRVPSSMRKWSSVIIESTVMIEHVSALPEFRSIRNTTGPIEGNNTSNMQESVHLIQSRPHNISSMPKPIQTSSSLPPPGALYSPGEHGGLLPLEESSQYWPDFSMFEGSSNVQLQDWGWEDIETILRGGSSFQ